MCGIFCLCFNNNNNVADNVNNLRLEDIFEPCKVQINNRGPDSQCVQTVTTDSHSFVFAASILWLQGENATPQPIETGNSVFVYNGDLFGGTLISNDARNKHGDTTLLLQALENSENISSTLSGVQGPYSFVYLDKRTSKLYFGRDIYGRRSLLLGSNGRDLLLTSVACKSMDFNFLELPAIGIFCYDLQSKDLEVFTWKFRHSNFATKLKELEVFLDKPIHIKEQIETAQPAPFITPVESDLTVVEELKGIAFCEAFRLLLKNEVWLNKVKSLESLLEVAVEKRIATQPKFCQNCIKDRSICDHALTGVLFSGGVDCAVLALLADKYTDKERPIDLLNIAFNAEAPDRLTGLETLSEIRRLRPERNWNFVAIDVAEEELRLARSKHIANLIYPLNTILDDSLGCALWFASRGENKSYKSPCRVLLVGMGADELFGGYTKHRAAFKRGGWSALHQFLEDDWQNISHRNLARDDRVVSDHGRQLRTPYLDEDVVEFVRKLNCWEKTCPTNYLPHGLGEKILLRSLAYHLGLENASCFKKRALQFGSRIANSKENAHDVSPRL